MLSLLCVYQIVNHLNMILRC